jgi:uncharacterized protein YcbX
MRTVARISVSPVKGFRLNHPDSVELGPDGVPGNRRFFVVDETGDRLRGSKTPWFALVTAAYDVEAEELTLGFPDGTVARAGALGNGPVVACRNGTLAIDGQIVEGPWTEPLSQLAGHPVRLARADSDRAVAIAAATIVSDGSLARFAAEAGVDELDSRRFRMLFELAGCHAHEEDAWEGKLLRVGDAVVRAGGPVDRCAVTTRDPATAERDVDALRVLREYRGQRPSDGAVLFGVYAHVETPGTVRVGDAVELV